MSYHRSEKSAYSPYSPYNPANQPPVTNDYAVDPISRPSSAKTPNEKMSASIHEMQPLAGSDMVPEGKGVEIAPEDEDSPYKMLTRKERNRFIFHAIRFVLTVIVIGVLLCVPLFVLADYADIGDSTDDSPQRQNLVFWIFTWLFSTWIIACTFHFIALILPYVFWLVAKFVNPAHRRYWRTLRPLRLPITLLGAILGSYVTFSLV